MGMRKEKYYKSKKPLKGICNRQKLYKRRGGDLSIDNNEMPLLVEKQEANISITHDHQATEIQLKWTEEQVIKLMRLYKEQCCLWDPSRVDYKNRPIRMKAYEEIVKQMEIPELTVTMCEHKIKNVRQQYYRELRKIRDAEFSANTSQAASYRPILSCFHIINEFLGDIMRHKILSTQVKKPSNTIPTQEVDVGPKVKMEEEINIPSSFPEPAGVEVPFTYSNEGVVLYPNVSNTDFSHTSIVSSSNGGVVLYPSISNTDLSHTSIVSSSFSTTLTRLESIADILSKCTQETEFDMFGRSIASQLKSMPYSDAIILQMNIQELITKYKLSLYSTT